MKLKDNREVITPKRPTFGDLKVGEVYEDEDGFICIKTSYSNPTENCIALVGGKWCADHDEEEAIVQPIEAELILKEDK